MGIVIISSRGCWRYRLMIAEKGERHFLNLKSRYNRKNSASVSVCVRCGALFVWVRALCNVGPIIPRQRAIDSSGRNSCGGRRKIHIYPNYEQTPRGLMSERARKNITARMNRIIFNVCAHRRLFSAADADRDETFFLLRVQDVNRTLLPSEWAQVFVLVHDDDSKRSVFKCKSFF